MTRNAVLSCSICIQRYVNRTFINPCYHSFCFNCILQWINTSPHCPLCRIPIESIIYNVNEQENTMDEYHLKNKGNNKLHNPPIKNNRRRTMKALGLKESRSLLYKGERTVEAHPQPLDKYIDLATIRPEHIPRAILFLEHELPLITGIEDQFVVDQIVNILLVPYHDKKKHMDDPFILHELAEWLKNDVKASTILLHELIAYIKSGLSYHHYISAIKYHSTE